LPKITATLCIFSGTSANCTRKHEENKYIPPKFPSVQEVGVPRFGVCGHFFAVFGWDAFLKHKETKKKAGKLKEETIGQYENAKKRFFETFEQTAQPGEWRLMTRLL